MLLVLSIIGGVGVTIICTMGKLWKWGLYSDKLDNLLIRRFSFWFVLSYLTIEKNDKLSNNGGKRHLKHSWILVFLPMCAVFISNDLMLVQFPIQVGKKLDLKIEFNHLGAQLPSLIWHWAHMHWLYCGRMLIADAWDESENMSFAFRLGVPT